MTFARNPADGERVVLLRPRDTELALKRLGEWNALLDLSGLLPGADPAAEKHWVEMLREQPWVFLGFLDDTKLRVLGHEEQDLGAVQPGDLNVFENRFKGWRRANGLEERSTAG